MGDIGADSRHAGADLGITLIWSPIQAQTGNGRFPLVRRLQRRPFLEFAVKDGQPDIGYIARLPC
jgi:hypothetical protein